MANIQEPEFKEVKKSLFGSVAPGSVDSGIIQTLFV
jgi:hypothetical protein